MKRKTEHFTYELIRAKRRSMSLKVDLDGTITVRAPYRTPVQTADWFVEGHRDWIEVRLKAGERIMAERPSYTDQERAEGRKRAAEAIRARCSHYAPLMGVSYGTITIREQKTRWGSCSAKGNLNFNWKLVLMPPEILDYVVVHELAHRLQMNHSAAFWAEVGKILPDYRERRQWLKVNGNTDGKLLSGRKTVKNNGRKTWRKRKNSGWCRRSGRIFPVSPCGWESARSRCGS